jgi:hypothetical protein
MTETLEKTRPAPLRILHRIAQRRPYFLIPNFDKSPYLLRLKIRGYLPPPKGTAADPKRYKLNVYLHRFLSKDQDRDLHNHPWKWSFAIVIWGGYIEEKRNRKTGKVVTRRRWPFWIQPWAALNVLGQQDFHRVIELKGGESWSLFFAGGKAGTWGFLVNGLFVRARDYLAAKGYVDEGPAPADVSVPDWLLTCACCAGRFPPPGNYYVRTPETETRRSGIRLPVCDGCARLPYQESALEESYAGV